MKRRFYVRREFSGVPHIEPVEEEIRRRIKMHWRDFERHHNRTRFEDDIIQMGLELMDVEGRYRRAMAAHQHKEKTAKFEDWIEAELQAAYDELRAEELQTISRIRLRDRARSRIAEREVNELKADALCARITSHKAERWLKRKK